MGVAHRKNALFDRLIRLLRARMRPARSVGDLLFGLPSAQPFITRLRVNTEPPAKLPPVRPFLHRKPNKLSPLIHNRHLAPWHGWPPESPNPCTIQCVGYVPEHLSVMSPV
jgi:hypothetical protein